MTDTKKYGRKRIIIGLHWLLSDIVRISIPIFLANNSKIHCWKILDEVMNIRISFYFVLREKYKFSNDKKEKYESR